MSKRLEDCTTIEVEGRKFIALDEAQAVMYQINEEGMDKAIESIQDAFAKINSLVEKI